VLSPEHRPHRAVEAEHKGREDDAPRFNASVSRAPAHVDGSEGTGGTVPGGSVRSQSVHAVPKGAKHGLTMANVTPAPERLQNTHTGAHGLGLGASTTTRGRRPWAPRRSRVVLSFQGALLLEAVVDTFTNRKTTIDLAPIALTSEFTAQSSTRTQWSSFRSKLPGTECPDELSAVVTLLAEFLIPIAHAGASRARFDRRWPPGGPWTTGT
jgi:hypothetical protein